MKILVFIVRVWEVRESFVRFYLYNKISMVEIVYKTNNSK